MKIQSFTIAHPQPMLRWPRSFDPFTYSTDIQHWYSSEYQLLNLQYRTSEDSLHPLISKKLFSKFRQKTLSACRYRNNVLLF